MKLNFKWHQSPKSASNAHPNAISHILRHLQDHNLCYQHRAIWCAYHIVSCQPLDVYQRCKENYSDAARLNKKKCYC